MRLLLAILICPLILAGAIDSKLEGVVRDSSGTGISDASLILRRSISREEMGRVHTDASGAYVFPLLPEGEYAMQVEAVGFMTVALDAFRIKSKEQRVLPPITLQTGYGCKEPVLRRLGLLANAGVEQGSLSGVATDPKERPVSAAKVTLICEGKGPCGSTVTDAQGHYSFAELASGKYAVRIQGHGFFQDDRQPYLVEAGYNAVYWPVALQHCHGRGCESKTKRPKDANCE